MKYSHVKAYKAFQFGYKPNICKCTKNNLPHWIQYELENRLNIDYLALQICPFNYSCIIIINNYRKSSIIL